MNALELSKKIDSQDAADLFAELYGSEEVEAAKRRYHSLIDGICGSDFSDSESGGDAPLRVFSASGRTELGGNHTDHNCGKVLAAAIQLDSVAVVRERKDKTVFFRSTGHRDVKVNLTDSSGAPALDPLPEEVGETESLIRGIAAEFSRRGIPVGGFSVNADSLVLSGSGLSSSAAVEMLFGRIINSLFGNNVCSTTEIAKIGQIAENKYFGKPCGLMDQIASVSGGVVAIDFAKKPDEAEYPRIRRIKFDLADNGYALCVVNTRGSHSDLTQDYAAITNEMKAVAAFFGKSVLAELDREIVLSRAADVRKAAGDRAFLRSLHFFDENDRVDQMTDAMITMSRSLEFDENQASLGHFLGLVNESGDSSWEFLQNIYSPRNVETQGLSVALALSKNFFRRHKIMGAYRVHGGGFAGTIQAYVPLDALAEYRAAIESVFGANSVTVLRIRSRGATELFAI